MKLFVVSIHLPEMNLARLPLFSKDRKYNQMAICSTEGLYHAHLSLNVHKLPVLILCKSGAPYRPGKLSRG